MRDHTRVFIMRKTNYCAEFETLFIPVIVLFAIYVAVSGIARELRVQRQFAFGALQAPDVPAHVHRGQIETVVYRSAATGAASSVAAAAAAAAVLRIGYQSRAVDILQHIRPQNMTCANNAINIMRFVHGVMYG